jgi:hypothetical protein
MQKIIGCVTCGTVGTTVISHDEKGKKGIPVGA